MGWFRAKVPVDNDEFDWLVACFTWLRKVLDDADIRPDLVLPDDPRLASAKTAAELFDAVRSMCGMDDWACRLERVDTDFDPGDMRVVTEGSSACGTFSVEQGEAVIRYSSAMVRNPQALAATFAHELCHYLLAGAGDPPGGAELMEHSTDCAAAYLGWGVLLANNARNFEQWTDGQWQGWRSSTAGYLSEPALVTATALFCALHDYDPADAAPALKDYLQSDFREAAKAIARDVPDPGEAMARVDLADWGVAVTKTGAPGFPDAPVLLSSTIRR